eukprot:GHRQ01039255.1.p1 GENE.GHRQ01039255.1~~GHRQ01039255.1.p1  ORF type:complete len:139 (+),score=24.38 GHRQ01039255.1:374-790(+)
MNFLLSTFLLWKVMLLNMAARKPVQLKVVSLKLAMITPPTIGTNVTSTGTGGTFPRKMADMITEKNGSMACAADHSVIAVQGQDACQTVVRTSSARYLAGRQSVAAACLAAAAGGSWPLVSCTGHAGKHRTSNHASCA